MCRLWLPITALLLLAVGAHSQELSPLGYTYCAGIADPDSRTWCLDYVNSNKADVKWRAAVEWSKYRPGHYECANITSYCLIADMQAERYGSSCKVANNGSPCHKVDTSVGSCWQGMCGDPAQVAITMLLARDGVRPEALPLGDATQQFREAGPPLGSYDYLEFHQADSGDDYSYQDEDVTNKPPSPAGSTGNTAGGGGTVPPSNGAGGSTSNTVAPLPPVDDPYGLNVQLPSNPKITDPFTPSPPPPAPPPPPPPPPPPQIIRASLTMDIQPDSFTGYVPASFLGISREWTPAVYWDKNLPAFGNIFEVLGPAPIVRIGGLTQEAILKPPNSTFINSLITLHCALGVRYIIGLPLFQNAPMLSLAVKKTLDDAFKDYPYAILSYELGNEPNYWPGTKEGGFTPIRGAQKCVPVQYNDPSYELVGTMDTPTDKAGGVSGYAVYKDYQQPYVPYKPSQYCYTPEAVLFVPGTDSYLSYFATAAQTITGCGGLQSNMQALWGFPYWGPPGFNRQTISGPGWGNFASFNLTSFTAFLKNSNQCYLTEVTMHYYGPNRNTTYDDLFADLLKRPDPTSPVNDTNKALIDVVGDYIDTARLANVGLRISESNSVPDGGQSGLSNTLGAAIWTLVTSLEFAKAGASGINFHWGNGGKPSDPKASPAYIGVQAFFTDGDPDKPYPVPRVPWYGYVMFSRALGNNGPGMFMNYSTNVAAGAGQGPICRDQIYYYPLLVPHAGMISIVVANRNPNVSCDFTATLPGVVTTAAVLQRLRGPAGMDSVPYVTLAGQTYAGTTDGRIAGTFQPEIIQPHQESIRSTGWNFTIDPGSAVLVQIPLMGGGTSQVGVPPITPNLVAGGTQQAAPITSAAWQMPQAMAPSLANPAAAAAAADGTQGQAGPQTLQQPGIPSATAPAAGAGTQPSSVAALGLSPQDTSGYGAVLDKGAGEYVFKGLAADGSPIYTWRPAAGDSYAASNSNSSSSSGSGSVSGSGGGPGSTLDGSLPGAAAAAMVQALPFPESGHLAGVAPQGGYTYDSSGYAGSAHQRTSSSSSSSSKHSGSKPSGGLGSLLGGLFGRGRRLLSGVLDAALPHSVSRVLLQQQQQQQYSNHFNNYAYYNPSSTGGMSSTGPRQYAAAGSAASQYGAPAMLGIGRAWPPNANTSNLDVGLYGLGGYTLFPPGYDQAAVAKAAAQCPGIARIMTVQARANNRRR